MGTAAGQYATVAGVAARIPVTDATALTELGVFCDQVNAWIENTTHRVLAPLPAYIDALTAPTSVGATILHVTSTAGVALMDEIAVGPVTGVHESGPVYATTSTTITLGVPLVNAYLSTAPVERVYLRDGSDADSDDRQSDCLIEDRGIVVLRALEIASFTRGAFALIPTTDYWLRPTPQRRDPGYPATEIYMTNIPSPSNPYPAFFPGYGNIRYWGILGWPQIDDAITGLAERTVAGLWTMRSSSGAYDVAPSSDVSQAIPHLLSLTDWKTIRGFTRKSLEIL